MINSKFDTLDFNSPPPKPPRKTRCGWDFSDLKNHFPVCLSCTYEAGTRDQMPEDCPVWILI